VLQTLRLKDSKSPPATLCTAHRPEPKQTGTTIPDENTESGVETISEKHKERKQIDGKKKESNMEMMERNSNLTKQKLQFFWWKK
jgi:hypothetical protein